MSDAICCHLPDDVEQASATDSDGCLGHYLYIVLLSIRQRPIHPRLQYLQRCRRYVVRYRIEVNSIANYWLFTVVHIGDTTDSQETSDIDLAVNSKKDATVGDEQPPLTVLAWTGFFNSPMEEALEGFAACPQLRCALTSDRSSIETAAAVIVHPRNVVSGYKLPTRSSAKQRFVFLMTESPVYAQDGSRTLQSVKIIILY